MKIQVESRGSRVEGKRLPSGAVLRSSLASRPSTAFTLAEMLTVLAIMGILAALVVPVLKNVGQGDATLTAGQQLLGDIGRARQLAMSQRTTVYMVFVPTNFWDKPDGTFNDTWWTPLTSDQRKVATNLCGEQLTGYTFIAYGAIGDQPGNHQWHYLAPWQSLPDGTFIPLWKFYQNNSPFTFTDPITPAKTFSVYPFDYTNGIPFPTETNDPANSPSLPYLAFNYLGQLISSGKDSDPAGNGQDIPLARGGVLPAIDPTSKTFVLNPSPPPDSSPQVREILPGNSSNAYNIVHIDPLTGRATLEQPKMP